ncbi:MAG: GNAT family N-acetyltransferase [Anaerolineae bacterium]
MDRDEIIALYTRDQRVDVVYPTVRREVAGKIVRLVHTQTGGEGAVIYSRLDEAEVEAAIREQIDYFEGLGQDFEWKVYDYDTPPDLKDRLAAHGFELEDPDAIMVLDLQEAPESLFQPNSPAVRRINDPADIGDVMSVEEAVWGEDFAHLAHNLAWTLTHHPEQLSLYVAYLDGAPVSAGWVFFPSGSQFASLWGGSTLSEYRGRGLYTALLAARARETRGRGRRYLTVDASPVSRPILEKFGFQMIAWAWACNWKIK